MYIFNPTAANPSIQKHVANKIQIWALTLAAFQYTIGHISGDDNVWADLLSRWGATASKEKITITSGRMASLFSAPIAPDLDPDFTWPCEEDIKAVQDEAINKGISPTCKHQRNQLITREGGAIWTSTVQGQHMQLRICVIGHCGRRGHRGADTTVANIQEHFFWTKMRADIFSFCNSCLHCLTTTGGLPIPRPMAHTLHADKPNDLLHLDFLYMGPSNGDHQCVLILKDDASSLVRLEPCPAADTKHTVRALSSWFSIFGVVLT